MGSSLSAYYDDCDDYEYLCKKYGEKSRYNGTYTDHHYWLEDRNSGKTDVSFREYELGKIIQRTQNKIDSLHRELKNLNEELSKAALELGTMKFKKR